MSKWLDFFRKLAGKKAGRYGLVVVGLLALTVIAAGVYWGQPKEKQQPALKIIDDKVDLFIRDVHYTEVGESGNRLEINADSATFLKKENQARFDKVRMKLIQPDGKIYELTADRGNLRTDIKDVEIEGNVVIVSNRGDRFTTGRLQYSDKEKKISTEDVVTLQNPRFDVTGSGLVLLLNSEQVTIAKNVKARVH
ncbi:MAG TPA: LPS export ABC transporter periplasmic protein LptC [Syntrophales bacterium]|nr:LPS export ABC transporter periplasmic protein LptC [Syntrophales bacterium]